jgi:hypothetical protein
MTPTRRHGLNRVGRKRLWHEQTVARLPAGTLARVKLVLKPGESQMRFVAQAIVRAVERREKASKRAKRKP